VGGRNKGSQQKGWGKKENHYERITGIIIRLFKKLVRKTQLIFLGIRSESKTARLIRNGRGGTPPAGNREKVRGEGRLIIFSDSGEYSGLRR